MTKKKTNRLSSLVIRLKLNARLAENSQQLDFDREITRRLKFNT
jgi:hypothetical protein